MKIAVIGAGIVGISSANWLKKYGQDVTLYDMNDPGSQASYGNAGTYAKYANIPTNSSSYFYLFPYLLLNKNSPLFISLKRLNETFPWIIKYLSNCRNEKVNHTVQHLTTLLSHMDDGYEDLFNEANAEDYISRESIMYGWSTKLFFNAAKQDFPKREDLAETINWWIAVRCKSDRISKSNYKKIIKGIPNRLKYLDEQNFNTYPLKCD